MINAHMNACHTHSRTEHAHSEAYTQTRTDTTHTIKQTHSFLMDSCHTLSDCISLSLSHQCMLPSFAYTCCTHCTGYTFTILATQYLHSSFIKQTSSLFKSVTCCLWQQNVPWFFLQYFTQNNINSRHKLLCKIKKTSCSKCKLLFNCNGCIQLNPLVHVATGTVQYGEVPTQGEKAVYRCSQLQNTHSQSVVLFTANGLGLYICNLYQFNTKETELYKKCGYKVWLARGTNPHEPLH